MLLSIQITDNFTEIKAEYKKIKQIIFSKLYEASDKSFQRYENHLINSIENILQSPLENHKISDENLIRGLIGAKILSKFTLLNQKKCVDFFSIINEIFPQSIQKRRFFIQSVAKQCNNIKNSEWDDFIFNFHSKILARNSNSIESITNFLIYVHFLIQYAPDFICKFSTDIFLRLMQIIQTENYLLDLNFDIISFTNQTIDTYFADNRVSTFYANYAIELLRTIFDQVKLINLHSIKIDNIIQWNSIKSLALLSILFEKCPSWCSNDKIGQIHQFLTDFVDSNSEIHCLLIRNKIYYSILTESKDQIDLPFYFTNESENVISGFVQNIKLWMNSSLFDENRIDNQQINDLIKNCIENDQILLKKNGYDLLNSCIYNNIEINPFIIAILFSNEFYFDYFNVFKLMKEFDDQSLLVGKVIDSIAQHPLETLQFFNDNMQDEFMKEFLTKVIDEVYYLIDNVSDCDVKSLALSISAQISPKRFFSQENIKKFVHLLLVNPFQEVKLVILQCFNNYVGDLSDLESKLSESNNNIVIVFKLLFSIHSAHKIRLETIKLIKKLSHFKSLNLNVVVEPYLSFFMTFSDEENNEIQNFRISPHQLTTSCEFLPIIFESFPNYIQKYFKAFYYFAMDFMNMSLNIDDFIKHSKLNLKVPKRKFFFQKSFYTKIFCSYSEALEVILEKNTEIIQPYFEELINFSYKSLQKGVGQLETQSILSLLQKIIFKMGLKQVVSNDKIQNINKLFTVVYNTGSRFSCPNIHRNIFRILGFLGAQSPLVEPKPLYINENEKNPLNSDLQNEFIEHSHLTGHDHIYYIVCSDSLLKILNDESMNQSHFVVVKSLIKLIRETNNVSSVTSFLNDYFKTHLKFSIKVLKKLIEKNEYDNNIKDLIATMLELKPSILIENVFDFVQIFIALWDHGSIDLFESLTKKFGLSLRPFSGLLIPYITSYNDLNIVINSLFCYLVNSFKFNINKSPYEIDIIVILIKLGNKGNYNVISLLKTIMFQIANLHIYATSIIDLCLNCLQKCIGNDELLISANSTHIDDAIILSGKIIHKYNALNYYIPTIKNLLQPYDSLLKIFDDSLTNANNRLCINRPKPAGSERVDTKPSSTIQIKNDLIQQITSIDNYIENKINSVYIDLWLTELIQFCIKNSPCKYIRNCFSVAASNQSFAVSIFNVAFHSFIKEYYERKNQIASTFLKVLKSDDTSHHCYAIITDLIEFMDRTNYPLLQLDDFKNPLTSIFSSTPPLSLRYALLKFEKNQKTNFQEDLLNDLEQAFLNCGSLDQYQQLSRLYDFQNANKRYTMPILANSFEDRDLIEKMGKNIGNLDTLNKMISKFHLKTISHICKAQALIQMGLNSNKFDEYKEKILNEIALGFDNLSHEGGPHFFQGYTSVLQSIMYSQQLIELKEMLSSNFKLNDFILRFMNSGKIISFLPQVLLLRISTKGENEDSLIEKLNLLSLCRKSDRWILMNIYYNFFNFKNDIPVEVQYEMMYYKINNNLAKESEINDLINQIQNEQNNNGNLIELGDEYKHSNLLKYTKYQKAIIMERSNDWKSVLDLCQDFDNVNAINLCGLANLQIFKLNNDMKFLNESIKIYIKSSIQSGKVRISNILLIIYLLFKHFNKSQQDNDIDQIAESLDKIPFHFYIDVMSQFISYIPNLIDNSKFKDYIFKLLSGIMIKYPQGVIYDYSFSIFSDIKYLNNDDNIIIESPIKELKESINIPSIQKIFAEVDSLVSNLIEVNKAIVTGNKPTTLFDLSKKLKENRQMSLPVFGTYRYDEDIVFIHEIDPKYEQIKSNAKPKRIKIIGIDGHSYPFILKSNEDLRADQRIMIFHKFLNQFLKTKIKTYSITPLDFNQGIIQSVQEMEGLDKLIISYRRKVVPKKVKYEYDFLERNPGLYDNIQDFNQRLIKFQEFINDDRGNDLRESFWSFTISSENWLKFKTNFTSSCAVLSMVTYMIGLGDRHLKNIMISKDNGMLMNIDFRNIFERDIENVPIRLTRNIVSAFGPCKCQGSFRVYCEQALAIIRENRDNIKNILEVFVDSPTAQISGLIARQNNEMEESIQFAQKSLSRIEMKLNGTDGNIIYTDEDDTVDPMSVHQQVENIIKAATDERKLCLQYACWEPWK